MAEKLVAKNIYCKTFHTMSEKDLPFDKFKELGKSLFNESFRQEILKKELIKE